MLVGIKYVLGRSQTHFSLRVKMSTEKGPKYIYAQENKLYYYLFFITLEGIEQINTKKMDWAKLHFSLPNSPF